MPGTNLKVLIVDDEPDACKGLRRILRLDGYKSDIAHSVQEMMNARNWHEYSAILLDRKLPDGSAEELLPRLKTLAPNAAIIVVTGYADMESSIAALRDGAEDYIIKPINGDALRASLARIVRLQRAEERAQRAERLAAIGETMAVLVHESRNAFQLAGASLDMLAWNLEGNEDNLKLVERVRKHQARVSRLFEDVRGYAAPIQLDRSSVDVMTVLRESADQVRTLYPSRTVRIEVDALENPETPILTSIDVSRMEQVFRNLLENSIAACSDPVEIGIRCAITQSGGEPMIQLQCRDNGPGLSADCRKRIFEPFFTTKAKGTGLGMAISRRIVEAHGGTMEAVVREEQVGAEFLIKFPVGRNSESDQPL